MSEYLLNGLDPGFFGARFIYGILGMILWFGSDVWNAVKTDTTTPNKFHFKSFLKGTYRVIACLILIFIGITHYPEYMKFLISIQSPGDINQVIMTPELTGWAAFAIGIFSDNIAAKFVLFGKTGVKYINSKMNK